MKKHIWVIDNCPADFLVSEFAKRNEIAYNSYSSNPSINSPRQVKYLLSMTDEDASVMKLSHEGLTIRKVKWQNQC